MSGLDEKLLGAGFEMIYILLLGTRVRELVLGTIEIALPSNVVEFAIVISIIDYEYKNGIIISD